MHNHKNHSSFKYAYRTTMTSQLVQVLARLVFFAVFSEEFCQNSFGDSKGALPVLLVSFVRLVLLHGPWVVF